MTLDKYIFRRTAYALFLACLFAWGCNQNVKVTGKVTYSDNGEPVGKGTVFFIGEKEQARAEIKDGKYSVGLLKDGEGIPPGKYTVSSESLDFSGMSSGMALGGGPAAQMDTTGEEFYYTKEPQTIEVQKSMNYDFQVERGSR